MMQLIAKPGSYRIIMSSAVFKQGFHGFRLRFLTRNNLHICTDWFGIWWISFNYVRLPKFITHEFTLWSNSIDYVPIFQFQMYWSSPTIHDKSLSTIFHHGHYQRVSASRRREFTSWPSNTENLKGKLYEKHAWLESLLCVYDFQFPKWAADFGNIFFGTDFEQL